MPRIFKWSFRAKYADTDKMQVVYYGRYFEYFEVARNEMLRELGYTYTKLESQKIMLPVIEAHAFYKHPVYYDDILVIHSFISKFENVRLTISYDMFRSVDESLEKTTEGRTVHAFVHSITRKPSRPPEELLVKIQSSV